MTIKKIKTLCTLGIATALMGCAATTPGYKAQNIRGNEPAILVSGTRAFTGSACLATIVIDGAVAGTVGPYEMLAVRVPPGPHLLRWDKKAQGACPTDQEGLAMKLITVKDTPVSVRLEIRGTGKMFIPVAGAFAEPEYRIALESEE